MPANINFTENRSLTEMSRGSFHPMKVDCHLVVITCDLCPETNNVITLKCKTSTKSIFVVTLKFHSRVPLIKKWHTRPPHA